MKKRLLAVLLAVCMLAACLPAAYAADGTRYFEDQTHEDVDFEDMEYVHMEMEDIQAEMLDIALLLGDGDNAAQVEEMFVALLDGTMQELTTMLTLANIRTSQDVYDEEAREEYAYTSGLMDRAYDALLQLMQGMVNSPCGAFLSSDEWFDEEDIEFIRTYEPMTEEDFEQSNRETELIADYYAVVNNFGNEQIDLGDGTTASLLELLDILDAAYAQALSTYSPEDIAAYNALVPVYNSVLMESYRLLNEDCGEIYLELVEMRNKTARDEGYDNYMDYAYENVYSRDYTPAEIREFEDAVKQYVTPLNNELNELVALNADNPVYSADYTGDIAFSMMAPYVGKVSAEMDEAFRYMLDHHLYDYGQGEGTKDGNGFTTILASYGAPYTFNTPNGDLYDFVTAVHEFGHYNRFYWTSHGFFEVSDGYDQSEVHSQGFELLFTQFYSEIFGDDTQAVLNYQVGHMTDSLLQGCLHDEFQQYAYTAEDLTTEMLNEEFRRLSIEYGVSTGEEDDLQAVYGWMLIPHTFERPGYYISYATSAAAALNIWLEAQDEGYEKAADTYLSYAALPPETPFREGLLQVGMEDPLTAEAVAGQVDKLYAVMNVDYQFWVEAMKPVFPDVDPGSDSAYYIWTAADHGWVQGDEDGFRPDDSATRAEAVTTLWNMNGQETGFAPAEYGDVAEDAWYAAPVDWATGLGLVQGDGSGSFSPDDAVTREQFAVILYRMAQALVDSGELELAFDFADLSEYQDAAEVSEWAEDAVAWCVYAGILHGDTDLMPSAPLTRAKMVEAVCAFAAACPAPAEEEAA